MAYYIPEYLFLIYTDILFLGGFLGNFCFFAFYVMSVYFNRTIWCEIPLSKSWYDPGEDPHVVSGTSSLLPLARSLREHFETMSKMRYKSV